MISYAHSKDITGPRFCQYKKDKIPKWAVDIKPYNEKEEKTNENK